MTVIRIDARFSRLCSVALAGILATLLCSCTVTTGRTTPGTETGPPSRIEDDLLALAQKGPLVARRAIMLLTVDDALQASELAAQSVASFDGRIEQTYTESDRRASLLARVPDERTVDVLDQLAGLGTVERRLLNTEDVTARIVDMGTTLRENRALHARLTELRQQTTDAQEAARLDQQIETLRLDISNLETELRDMYGKVRMSTLEIDMHRETGLAAAILRRCAICR